MSLELNNQPVKLLIARKNALVYINSGDIHNSLREREKKPHKKDVRSIFFKDFLKALRFIIL